MLKFIVGFWLGCMAGCSLARSEEPASCAPCRIVASIIEQDGAVVEKFESVLSYPDFSACETARTSSAYVDALNDLQKQADKLGMLIKEFQGKNLKAISVCGR